MFHLARQPWHTRRLATWTFAWLDKMYDERSPVLIWMNEHTRYDSLRGDLRFQELPRKIGFHD